MDVPDVSNSELARAIEQIESKIAQQATNNEWCGIAPPSSLDISEHGRLSSEINLDAGSFVRSQVIKRKITGNNWNKTSFMEVFRIDNDTLLPKSESSSSKSQQPNVYDLIVDLYTSGHYGVTDVSPEGEQSRKRASRIAELGMREVARGSKEGLSTEDFFYCVTRTAIKCLKRKVDIQDAEGAWSSQFTTVQAKFEDWEEIWETEYDRLKENRRFLAKLDDDNSGVASLKRKVESMNNEIQNLQKKMKTMKPGAPPTTNPNGNGKKKTGDKPGKEDSQKVCLDWLKDSCTASPCRFSHGGDEQTISWLNKRFLKGALSAEKIKEKATK